MRQFILSTTVEANSREEAYQELAELIDTDPDLHWFAIEEVPHLSEDEIANPQEAGK